jgi:hypothetical protein
MKKTKNYYDGSEHPKRFEIARTQFPLHGGSKLAMFEGIYFIQECASHLFINNTNHPITASTL